MYSLTDLKLPNLVVLLLTLIVHKELQLSTFAKTLAVKQPVKARSPRALVTTATVRMAVWTNGWKKGRGDRRMGRILGLLRQ